MLICFSLTLFKGKVPVGALSNFLVASFSSQHNTLDVSIRAADERIAKLSHELAALGAFHLVKISGISGSAVNGTRFVGSSHWKIPRKSGKSKKVVLFSRLEFPNGMSCSIYVSRSLYQFQVHGRAPRRTGV